MQVCFLSPMKECNISVIATLCNSRYFCTILSIDLIHSERMQSCNWSNEEISHKITIVWLFALENSFIRPFSPLKYRKTIYLWPYQRKLTISNLNSHMLRITFFWKTINASVPKENFSTSLFSTPNFDKNAIKSIRISDY